MGGLARALGLAARAALLATITSVAVPAVAQDRPAADPARQAIQQADPRRAIEQQFLLGLALVQSGNPGPAIRIFRAILAIDPTLVRVRLELARAYFVAEQWGLSRREFFVVLSGDLPPPVRANVLNFIRAIDSRRGFEWDLSLGLRQVGDGRSFDSDVILLDVFGGEDLPFAFERRGSELGFELSGGATLRRPLGQVGNGTTATGALTGFFRLIDASGRAFDDVLAGARAELSLAAPRQTTTVGPVFTRRWLAGERYEDSLGLELRFERRTGAGNSVFGSLSGADLQNFSNDTLDGELYRGQVGARRSLGGRAAIGVAAFAERRDVSSQLNNHRTLGLRAFGVAETVFGLTVSPSLSVSRRHYLTPPEIFAPVGDLDEWRVEASVRIEKNDWFIADGFSPYVTLSGIRVNSGIDAFSYSDGGVGFGLTRNF